MMGLQLLQFHLGGGGSAHPRSSSVLLPPLPPLHSCTTVDGGVHPCRRSSAVSAQPTSSRTPFTRLYLRRKSAGVSLVSSEDNQLRTSIDSAEDADPEDLENVRQIQTVLAKLKKNRDMLFSEVRLTIMIEDPREVERRRLSEIEYSDSPTRDDLVAALDQVNEGKVPENSLALKLLAKEMLAWPNLEVVPIQKKPTKSRYARATDTGIDPLVAAKRLNIGWGSSAADTEDTDQ